MARTRSIRTEIKTFGTSKHASKFRKLRVPKDMMEKDRNTPPAQTARYAPHHPSPKNPSNTNNNQIA